MYFFKVNSRNIRKRCEIWLKLTIKKPERRQWRFSLMNCYASKTKFYFNPTPKNKIKIEELKLINPGRSNTGNSVVFTNEVLKTSRKCQVNIGISAKISGINDFLQKIFSRVFKSKQALTYLIHCKDHPHLYFLYNVVHIHILSSC